MFRLATRSGLTLIAATSLSGAGLAHAQEASGLLAGTPSPRAEEPLAPLTSFSVEGSQDGGVATVKLGGQDNRIYGGPGGDAVGTFATYSIALSAPLDEDADFQAPLTLDGLANAASIGVQLSWLIVPAADYPPNATPQQRIDALGAVVTRYWGFNGKVGYKNYTYYDPLSLDENEAERTPWRAGLFHAWIRADRSWSATVQYAHEVTFEETKSKTLCRAGAGPLLDCVSGPIGRVERQEKDILSLEVRRSWGPRQLWMVTPKIGIAPKVAYDANNDHWAVGLPVYLFGDKTGLTGGVRADWESDKHDIVVGVFLTKAFSISD